MQSWFDRSRGIVRQFERAGVWPGVVRAFLPIALSIPLSCQSAISTWMRWEQSLTSTRHYANPYSIELKLTCTGPNHKTIHGLGFWDGGNVFKIRCLFPEPGRWTWSTACSDTNNPGLHQRRGAVEVAPYSGSNRLYRHGLLRVSRNRRFLTYADGTPFLWIGDTPWAAPMNARMEDWRSYIRDRREKRFTVLQIFCASRWAGTKDVNGEPPFLDDGLSQPNPAYWRQYEQKVELANERGLVVLIVGLMEPVNRYPDAVSAQAFARYLAARLMGNFVVFSPSFDSPYLDLGNAVGKAIREATALHLITQHPSGMDAPQRYYDEPYLDFCGVQTGAGWGGNPLSAEIAARHAIECSLTLYNHSPHKPVINLESRYDSAFNQKQMPRLPRSCGYWSFLSGCAGYSYGCAGLFNWELTGSQGDPQATPWDWHFAMDRATSTEMKHMSDFFSRLDWWRLEPQQGWILNQSKDWTRRMVGARSAAGDLAVAYLPDNGAITLEMTGFQAAMRWRWFNPKTGEAVDGEGPVRPVENKTFTRPAGWEDALLVLRNVTDPPPPDPTGGQPGSPSRGQRAFP